MVLYEVYVGCCMRCVCVVLYEVCLVLYEMWCCLRCVCGVVLIVYSVI